MGGFTRFPETHHRAAGRHSTRLQDGTQVVLEISKTSRPLRGHELVKAGMAIQMGRFVSSRVSELSISLFVGRAGRMEIEITNSGHYRCGRYMQRSLRSLVEQIADTVAPQDRVGDDREDGVPSPGLSR